jgi:sterol desaturase/sphingolipid hydroxylase (fatty acid hydroxylase superfamily)
MSRMRDFDLIASPLLVAAFSVLAWLQWRYPLRIQHFAAARRILRNLVLSVPAFLIARLALLPLPLALTILTERHHFGLLHWLPFADWLAGIVGILLLDYIYWWWHFRLHRVPFLWRFHNVHHTDLDMDVSTAARFHFGEMILSVFLFLIALPFIGISPSMFVVFWIVFEVSVQFQHSNWRLPVILERSLNRIFVTPRMHGIHHSIVEAETNSNWGTIFVWWDWIHGTLRRDVPQHAITIGVPAYRDERELTIGQLLALPFKDQRPWRLPNGEIPNRSARPADELTS